jgi:hypothetical protein
MVIQNHHLLDLFPPQFQVEEPPHYSRFCALLSFWTLEDDIPWL